MIYKVIAFSNGKPAVSNLYDNIEDVYSSFQHGYDYIIEEFDENKIRTKKTFWQSVS